MEWPPEVGALQEMVSPFPVWPPLPLLGGLINMYFPGDPIEGAIVMGVVKEAGPPLPRPPPLAPWWP